MNTDAQILIIDDDRVSQMTLERMLKREGYGVRCASGGDEGLRLARELEPDLVLLDVLMPGMDGYAVCQALRSDPRLAEVPIVMITSLGDRASRIKGLEAGADDFLSKPYQTEELRARVRTITRLNRYRRLRTERARFGWLVEQAEDVYLLVSSRGDLLYANERARLLFGWSGSSGEPKSVLEGIAAQFTLHPEEEWKRFPNLGPDVSLYLWRAECEQSPAVWLEVKVLRQATGKLDSELLLKMREVTDELASQRSVWSFESIISHKMRTPLTKATIGLTLLRRKAHKLSPEQVVEFAQQAFSGVEELGGELERVLKYVNSPSVRPRGPGFALAALPGLLEETCGTLAIPVGACRFEGPLPEALFIEPRAFELAFWEVLENSKKYHPNGTPHVLVTVSAAADGLVMVQFKDDGRRVTPRQLEGAFAPYFQGEKYFTGQVPGMGLGLSTLRAMLWEVGGSCTLANRSDAEGIVLELGFRPWQDGPVTRTDS